MGIIDSKLEGGVTRANQSQAEAGNDNISYATSLRVAQAIAAMTSAKQGALTPHENLVCKYATAATVDIDADAVLLFDTNGIAYKADSVDLTVDVTASGANGLDTGSEATATWYYLWVIYNGSTVAGLLSTSATAPTLPSGYTYKGLVGAAYNGSGGDLVDFYQSDKHFSRSTVIVLSNGGATSYTSVDLSTAVPPIMKTIIGDCDVDATGQVGANGSIAATSGGLSQMSYSIVNNGGDGRMIVGYTMNLVEQQTIYYAAGSGDKMNVKVSGGEY